MTKNDMYYFHRDHRRTKLNHYKHHKKEKQIDLLFIHATLYGCGCG